MIFGTVLAAVAVVVSFRSASALHDISKGSRKFSPRELGSVSARVWVSLVCGTAAGMAQAWEGNTMVAVVWAVFVALQCSNLSTVRTAKTNLPPISD
jgi:hypothetical protein